LREEVEVEGWGGERGVDVVDGTRKVFGCEDVDEEG
jgi:hypothetical protein